jgi:hypothetical protein
LNQYRKFARDKYRKSVYLAFRGITQLVKGKLTSSIIGTLIVLFVAALLIQTTDASSMNAFTYGGSNSDYTYGIVATPDGGHLLVGAMVTVDGGYSDVWLIKVDAHGNTVWNRTYGGAYTDVGCNIIAASDGNYLIVGYTAITNATGDHECTDSLLIKVDSEGNLLWSKTYGAPMDSEYTTVIAATANGGYALAGGVYPNVTEYSQGIIIKVDAEGNQQWLKTYDEGAPECFWGITPNRDESLTLTGSIRDDLLLIKVNHEGSVVWSMVYGADGNDQGWWILPTSDGGYIVSGSTTSYGAGSIDAWLLKFNSDGTLQWNQTYGGYADDTAFVLTKTADGGYAVVGSTCSYGAGDSDFWLIRTDSKGAMQWNQTYGGSGYDVGQCVIVNSKGVYAVAGVTASFGAGGSDGWLIITESPQIEAAIQNGVLKMPSTATLAVVVCLLLLSVAVVVVVKKQK